MRSLRCWRELRTGHRSRRRLYSTTLWSCDVLAQVVPDLLQVLLHFLGVVARIALGDRMGNLLKVHS
jgi:hypothetical protein